MLIPPIFQLFSFLEKYFFSLFSIFFRLQKLNQEKFVDKKDFFGLFYCEEFLKKTVVVNL